MNTFYYFLFFSVLPDAKISLWPFLAQKMPKSVKKIKNKKYPKPNLAAQLLQKIIVDTQPNESQITL
jgi:hypothetical protein